MMAVSGSFSPLVWPALLALSLFFSCARAETDSPEDKGSGKGEGVSVELAFSVAGVHSAGTKSSIASITEIADDPAFRGMESIVLFPFTGDKSITMSDRVLMRNVPLGDISGTYDYQAVSGLVWNDGLVYHNNSHLYGDIMLPKSTGSVLVYGRAVRAGSDDEASLASRQLNGSMIVSGLDTDNPVRTPGEISFAPDPIYSSAEVPAAATTMVDLLNSLFNTPYTIYYYTRSGGGWFSSYTYTTQSASQYWNGSVGDNLLRGYFQEFTSGGSVVGGSATSIEALLTNLYRHLQLRDSNSSGNYNSSYYSNTSGTVMTNAEWYNRLRDAICERIASLGRIMGSGSSTTFQFYGSTADLRDYPSSLGLPDGCAAIRWTGSAFAVVDNADPANGMAQRSSYCFPPSLWYYANSAIKTSVRDDERDQYVSSNSTWNSILSSYSDAPVSSNTQSVAVVEPLRYAPALLEMTLIAQSATLADNDNDNATNVTVGTTNFPLTAVIIGGQRAQNYSFTPSNAGDWTVYSLYDTNVRSAGNQQIYLSRTKTAACRVLVFPTPADADISLALEFTNNSGSRFFGADQQLIPPGGHFYLIGSLKISDKDEAARTVGGKVLNSVFTRAYKTTVNFTVSSMKDAVNTIPDLKEPQLALGVSADIDWKEVTPQNLPLY